MTVHYSLCEESKRILILTVHNDMEDKIREISFIDSPEAIPVSGIVVWLSNEPPSPEIADKVTHVEVDALTNAMMVRFATGRGVPLSQLLKGAKCFFAV